MGQKYAFDLLASQFSVVSHVDCLEELGYLQVHLSVFVLLVELDDLSLYFLHDLDLTLEELG